MTTPSHPTTHAPAPEAGVTMLELPDSRSAALHHLVIETLCSEEGTAIWVDARNAAAAPLLKRTRRSFLDIRLARAFTLYQHHELIRRLPATVTAATPLVVVPRIPSLYVDDDVPMAQAKLYFRATMEVLGEIATTFDVPVVASYSGSIDGEIATIVAEATDTHVDVVETSMGLRYEGLGTEPAGYHHRGYWQTTIPYWVDLCGKASEVASVETTAAAGWFEATVPGGV